MKRGAHPRAVPPDVDARRVAYGRALSRFRGWLELTREALGDRLGITQYTVQRIEDGLTDVSPEVHGLLVGMGFTGPEESGGKGLR